MFSTMYAAPSEQGRPYRPLSGKSTDANGRTLPRHAPVAA